MSKRNIKNLTVYEKKCFISNCKNKARKSVIYSINNESQGLCHKCSDIFYDIQKGDSM